MNWPIVVVTAAALVANFVTGRLIYWQRRLIEAQKAQIEAKDRHIAALTALTDTEV